MALSTWLAPSSLRFYPRSPARRSLPLALEGALNEQLSFQVCLRLDGADPRKVRLEVDGPADWGLRLRRVGYVPVRHLNTGAAPGRLEVEGREFLPGYAPDPLFDETEMLLPPGETHAFWVTVRPGPAARAGVHPIAVRVSPDGARARTLQAEVILHDLHLRPREGFAMTHWFYADALCDWYRVTPFSEPFWGLCEAYLRNYAGHGLDMIYVPVFTPPLDGVKRPTQLLRVSRSGPDRYQFDWTDVRRWLRLARSCGLSRFEWTHPFTQWGARHAIRIYAGQGLDETLLWDPQTPATSETYRAFLGQYLPELHRLLLEEDALEQSCFHVSDEPHTESDKEHYIAARGLLRELAPWMRTMDALTDIAYGRERLTDMPVPSIRTALQFHREGIPSWCYYCCGPRGAYLNRLIDTPLAKIGMHGFLFYRWPFQGFLHWGYNYWYRSQTRELIDPYAVQDGHAWPGWAYGDTCVVYPGPDGPRDSIRWEVFAESLQDYRLLQTLGIAREADLLSPLRDFNDFPKASSWRRAARQALLRQAD